MLVSYLVAHTVIGATLAVARSYADPIILGQDSYRSYSRWYWELMVLALCAWEVALPVYTLVQLLELARARGRKRIRARMAREEADREAERLVAKMEAEDRFAARKLADQIDELPAQRAIAAANEVIKERQEQKRLAAKHLAASQQLLVRSGETFVEALSRIHSRHEGRL